MAKKIKKKKTAKALNREYFQSLIATRASLGKVNMYFAGAIFAIIFLTVFWYAGSAYHWGTPYDPLSFTLITCIFYMLCWGLTAIIPVSKRWLYQHQDISGFLQTLFIGFLIIVFAAAGLIVATFKKGYYSFYTPTTGVILAVFVFTFFISFIYNIFWLKRQLAIGFSSERTRLNFLSQPAVRSSGSLAFIFSGSMMGRYLTQGQANLLGLVFGIGTMIIYSRLLIEYAYAAILKRRDKSYWEVYEPVTLTSQQKQSYSRLFVRIAIIIAEIVVFFALVYIGMQVLPQSHPLVQVIRFCVIAILVYWLIRIIRFIWKIIKKASD